MPVATNEVPHLPARILQPSAPANTFPCGYLRVYQDPQLVTGIQEDGMLWIVGQADEIAPELAQQLRVMAVQPGSHGVSNSGNALMPVASAQRHSLPVQETAVPGKLDGPNARPERNTVQNLPGQQFHFDGVKGRVGQLPELGSQ